MQGSTAKYIELSNEAYGLIVDTFASATRSRLAYWSSVWGIASRPYASTAIASTVRENFDRAHEFANLTMGELDSRVRRTANFSEKFLAQVGEAQDAAVLPVAEIVRKLGISEAVFYVRKNRFEGFETPEIRELRQLRDENAQLKRLVADLTLNRQVCEMCSENGGTAAGGPSPGLYLRTKPNGAASIARPWFG
jgi:putative transposase